MITRRISITLLSIVILGFTCSSGLGQGGWRQWEIRFLDGTSVEANPLQMRDNGRFTRSMDPKEAGFDRTKIDYIAAISRNANVAFPPAPTGRSKQDLIVFLNGKRSLGKVIFKSLRFSEGTIVQNGKEMSLENVAYVKFAHATQARSADRE